MGEDDARAFTAEYVTRQSWRATVYCATCRLWTGINPLALSAAGKGQRPLSTLTFRCRKCKTVGVLEIDTGFGAYDVKSGAFKPKP